jgi:hypothetical protein
MVSAHAATIGIAGSVMTVNEMQDPSAVGSSPVDLAPRRFAAGLTT